LRQGTKDIHAPLPEFCVGNRLAHQVRNDGALVLSSEGLIELSFHVIGDAEIDGGHMQIPLLKFSTTSMVARISMAVTPLNQAKTGRILDRS
jgi:hypothetical protein